MNLSSPVFLYEFSLVSAIDVCLENLAVLSVHKVSNHHDEYVPLYSVIATHPACMWTSQRT